MPRITSRNAAPSTSKLMTEVKKISEEWFDLIRLQITSLPREATSDEIWARYTSLIDNSTQFCKRLITINVPLSTYTQTTGSTRIISDSVRNKQVRDTPRQPAILSEAVAGLVIIGAAEYAKASRYTAFSRRCLDLVPPNTDQSFNESESEMVFYPSDRFLQLSQILPGCHGWVFVFRDSSERALLSTQRFHLSYCDTKADKISYGVYRAMQWHEADLTGPEFMSMKQPVRTAIVSHVSKNPPGSEAFNLTDQAFATSRKTVSCFLLQCVQLPSNASTTYPQSEPDAILNPISLISLSPSTIEASQPPRLSWSPRLLDQATPPLPTGIPSIVIHPPSETRPLSPRLWDQCGGQGPENASILAASGGRSNATLLGGRALAKTPAIGMASGYNPLGRRASEPFNVWCETPPVAPVRGHSKHPDHPLPVADGWYYPESSRNNSGNPPHPNPYYSDHSNQFATAGPYVHPPDPLQQSHASIFRPLNPAELGFPQQNDHPVMPQSHRNCAMHTQEHGRGHYGTRIRDQNLDPINSRVPARRERAELASAIDCDQGSRLNAKTMPKQAKRFVVQRK